MQTLYLSSLGDDFGVPFDGDIRWEDFSIKRLAEGDPLQLLGSPVVPVTLFSVLGSLIR